MGSHREFRHQERAARRGRGHRRVGPGRRRRAERATPGGAVGPVGDGPDLPAVDDGHRRVRGQLRWCPGVGRDEDAGGVDDGEDEAARDLVGRPQGRPRPDRRRLETPGRPGRSPAGDRGPRRLRAVPAGAVPPAPQAPQHLRPVLLEVARSASPPAVRPGVGADPRGGHERAEPGLRTRDRCSPTMRPPSTAPTARSRHGWTGTVLRPSTRTAGCTWPRSQRSPIRRRWSICAAVSSGCCRRSTCPSWCWR